MLTADHQDLAFITLEVVDQHGTPCPESSHEITLTLRGQGTLAAFGNADIKDIHSTTDATHHVWKGRALAVLRTTHSRGSITLIATGKGLKPAKVALQAR